MCKCCHNPRGTKHPLSYEELLEHSDKEDTLSADGLTVRLADGSKSNALKLEVYSTHNPIVSPVSGIREPAVIFKEIGKITLFIDSSHPFFTQCSLSKEQMVASEVAMYIYQERMNLASFAEHNLSNLTWEVIESSWKDRVEIDFDSVYKDATDLLRDIQSKVKESLGEEAEMYFDELTNDEKRQLTNNLIQKGIDLSLIGELKHSGEYITYAPFSFILKVYQEDPTTFFGGKVWTTALVCGGEDLLGPEIIAQAKEKLISQFGGYLRTLVFFSENRYSDPLTLKSAKLSIEFLRKDLAI